MHFLTCSWSDSPKKIFLVASKAAVALAGLPSQEFPAKVWANITASLRRARRSGILGAHS
jgi:hypothetical protein